MKALCIKHFIGAVTVILILTLAPISSNAQEAATGLATTPIQLAYGVPQIVQLSQAKISDGTIINYIKTSGNSYGLDANQIIYLRQQGVSDAVVSAMLTQPKVSAATGAGSTIYQPAPTPAQTVVVAPQPQTVYVPSSTVYVIPDSQTYRYYNYYPYYGSPYYCSPISVSFGFGYYGGRYGGGYYGGWHGGGGHGHH